MTVLAFPYNTDISNVEFELADYVSTNLLDGGITQVREWAQRRWKAEWSTRPLDRWRIGSWRAFKDQQRGGLRGFYAYDPERPFPQSFPIGFAGVNRHSGAAFDGTATVTGLTPYTITMSTLPDNFPFKAGDYIGLIQSGYRYLGRVQVDVTGSALGIATVTVEPEINQLVYTAPSANLARPVCIMLIDPKSWNAPRKAGEPQAVTFTSYQKLY